MLMYKVKLKKLDIQISKYIFNDTGKAQLIKNSNVTFIQLITISKLINV